MSSNYTKEDIDKVFESMKFVEKKIGNENYTKAISLLGSTKSGKSTTGNILAGSKLFFKLEPILKTGRIEGENDHLKIGHMGFSETSIPHKFIIKKIPGYVCFDTQGFNDSQGKGADLVNAFTLQKIANSCENIAFLYVFSAEELGFSSLNNFINSIETISLAFELHHLKSSKDSIGYLCTHTDPSKDLSNYKQYIRENVLEFREKFKIRTF